MKLTGLDPHAPPQFRPEWPTVEMRIECHNFKHAKESGFWICKLSSETHQKGKSGVLSLTSPAALAVDAALYGFGALRRTCNVYLKCSHDDLHEALSGELVSHSMSMPPEPPCWSFTRMRQIEGWNDLVSVARQHAVSCGRLHWAEYLNALDDEAYKLIQERDPDGWGCPF